MDRLKTQPYGLLGSLPGARGGLYIRRKGETEFRTFVEAFGTASPGKFSNITVAEGDEILIVGPGGGGYGSPLQRAPETVLEDVREGFVSIESARRDYGLAIEEVRGELTIVKDVRDEAASRQMEPSPQKRPLRTSSHPPARLVIPADYWAVDEDGRVHRFCDQECERLYRDYWQPRYADRT
jgi:hypothetical protein